MPISSERCCCGRRRDALVLRDVTPRPGIGIRLYRVGGCLFLLILAACDREPVDSRPERVVEAFIERMSAVHGDPTRGKLALELLWKPARTNLQQRAERATAATGRRIEPEEMLVPSRFSLRFESRRFQAETRGDYSRVTVSGHEPSETAEVHCVREDGKWRVVVELPELPPIRRRGS